jgi:AAA+ superfamily predicted ATPase
MAYVVGSCSQDAFKPLYKLDDVILPDRLKEEAVGQIDYFFSEGIKDYAEFSVPPFRKMLIWGVPGTGKSMLAQALAGDQMAKGRVVIFVAASDRFGASFSKIQNALEICKNAKFPVFMVVEEIEAYIAGEEGLSQVRNVLEGFEVPNSKLGSFLLMTSNQPHILDSALLRFGRIDIRKEIPPIKDPATADLLLRKYLGALYPRVEDKIPQAAKLLHNIPPVFVRELAFTARMKAAANPGLDLAAALIETIEELKEQSTNQEAMSKEVEAALRRSQQRESSFPGFLGNMNRMEEETF